MYMIAQNFTFFESIYLNHLFRTVTLEIQAHDINREYFSAQFSAYYFLIVDEVIIALNLGRNQFRAD
jgi:hypothetical protein